MLQEQLPVLLIVEDDADSQLLYVELFTSEGWNVIAKGSRDEALQWFKSTVDAKVDVLLMDLGVPGVLGPAEFLTQIRARPTARKTYAVIVSGADNVREQAKQLGAEDFIRKPADLDVLIAAINKARPSAS